MSHSPRTATTLLIDTYIHTFSPPFTTFPLLLAVPRLHFYIHFRLEMDVCASMNTDAVGTTVSGSETKTLDQICTKKNKKTERLLSLDVGIKNLSFVDATLVEEHERDQENRDETQEKHHDDERNNEESEEAAAEKENREKEEPRRQETDVVVTLHLHVRDWDVLDICSSAAASSSATTSARTNDQKKKGGSTKMDTLSLALLHTLNDRFLGAESVDPPYSVVLIENQPVVKNPVMKTVQVVLYAFFQTVKILFGVVQDARFVSASAKLEAFLPKDQVKKMSYSERKRASVELCRRALGGALDDVRPSLRKRAGTKIQTDAIYNTDLEVSEYDKHGGWRPTGKNERNNGRLPPAKVKVRVSVPPELALRFEESKKKDDMADALMQLAAFVGLRRRRGADPS